MVHWCNNCPGTDALLGFLDKQLGEHFHYSQWEAADKTSLLTVTTIFEEYKEALIAATNSLTKHSFLAKCQANFLKSKKESLLPNEVLISYTG